MFIRILTKYLKKIYVIFWGLNEMFVNQVFTSLSIAVGLLQALIPIDTFY